MPHLAWGIRSGLEQNQSCIQAQRCRLDFLPGKIQPHRNSSVKRILIALNSGRGKAGGLCMLLLYLCHALLEDIEANGSFMLVQD
jgi:hypothetical protein